MPAVNTYHHTLNDYRLSTVSAYEGGSQSKVAAGALVIAIFLGVGAYFFYSAQHRSAPATSNDTSYQAPVVTDSALPAEAVDSGVAAASSTNVTSAEVPSSNATAAPKSAQDTAMTRTTPEIKSNVAPTQPAQRAKQSTKSLSPSTSEATPSPTSDTATAAPEVTEPEPTISPQPVAVDPAPASDAPTGVDPDAPIGQ